MLGARERIMAALDLVDLKAISQYGIGLMDAAMGELPQGFRHPTVAEVMEADRAAWQEALRLTAEGHGDLNATLVHVSKPAGFLSGVLRPMPKLQQPVPGLFFTCLVRGRLECESCFR